MLADIIRLEKEREEYETEILLKEKNLRKLKAELELAETEYNKLENSGLKKLLLGVVGKRNTRSGRKSSVSYSKQNSCAEKGDSRNFCGTEERI